jgi:GntR family transcriptional regulator
MSSTVAGRPAKTRHAGVSTQLRAAIMNGKYVPGSLLPTEHELAHLHGVSRQTIRTALQALEDRGYISRKKGVGTRVETRQPAGGFAHAFDSLVDLVRLASVEVRQIHKMESVVLDRAPARRLEAPLGSRWLCFSGLRIEASSSHRPVSWTRILIDERFAAIATAVREQPAVLVATLLERECGQAIEEVHQQVSATLLDEAMARALKTDPSTAALRILRHYKANPMEILEITDTIYPADRVTVSTRLRRTRSERGHP